MKLVIDWVDCEENTEDALRLAKEHGVTIRRLPAQELNKFSTDWEVAGEPTAVCGWLRAFRWCDGTEWHGREWQFISSHL
jgi:hypothetical protein